MYWAAGNLRLLPKAMKSLPFFPFHDLLSGGPCLGPSSRVLKVLRPKDYDTSVTSVLFDASPTPSGFSRNGGYTISRDNIGVHRHQNPKNQGNYLLFFSMRFWGTRGY